MRTKTLVFLLLMSCMSMSTNGHTDEVNVDDLCLTHARTLVAALQTGDTSQAVRAFDETMRAALSGEQLAAIWSQLSAKYGRLDLVGDPVLRKGEADAAFTVVVPLRFDVVSLDFEIACNTHAEVSGLHFLEATQEPVARAPADDQVQEDSISFEHAGFALGATVYTPKPSREPVPMVVFIGGSGPVDRDETIGANKPMREIAVGLAKSGVAAFTFDKRTFRSPGIHVATVDDEFVSDTVAAIERARAVRGVDPNTVFLLGHSLGATMAPRIAQRSGHVAGLILLAPLVSALDSAYIRQIKYLANLDGTLDPDESRLIEEAEADEQRLSELKKGNAPGGRLPLGLPATYWQDLLDYDAADAAANTGLPTLALFAGRDYQVLAGESSKALNSSFKDDARLRVKTYDELGHTFMPMSSPPNPAQLLEPGHVSDAVIQDIAAWVNMHAK